MGPGYGGIEEVSTRILCDCERHGVHGEGRRLNLYDIRLAVDEAIVDDQLEAKNASLLAEKVGR